MQGTKKADPSRTRVGDSARARLRSGVMPDGVGLWLRVEQGPGKGRTWEMSNGGVFLIGREGADIELDDPKVSRKHAELGLYGPDAFSVRDLASTNGTFVAGRRLIERSKISPGDELRVGDTVLQLVWIDRTVPLSD